MLASRFYTAGFAVCVELELMALEALPGAVAEATAFVLGKILKRTFKIEPERANQIGEWIIMGVIVTVGLAVTIIYSYVRNESEQHAWKPSQAKQVA